jgi:FixJ family two-component response regulator
VEAGRTGAFAAIDKPVKKSDLLATIDRSVSVKLTPNEP